MTKIALLPAQIIGNDTSNQSNSTEIGWKEFKLDLYGTQQHYWRRHNQCGHLVLPPGATAPPRPHRASSSSSSAAAMTSSLSLAQHTIVLPFGVVVPARSSSPLPPPAGGLLHRGEVGARSVRRRATAVGCRRRRAADVDDEEQRRKVPRAATGSRSASSPSGAVSWAATTGSSSPSGRGVDPDILSYKRGRPTDDGVEAAGGGGVHPGDSGIEAECCLLGGGAGSSPRARPPDGRDCLPSHWDLYQTGEHERKETKVITASLCQ
jgi:hypothetical protein